MRLAWVFVAILVMALFEVISVASILPFMQLVAEPNAIADNIFLSRAYEMFGFETQRAMLIAAGFAVLILLAVANAFSAITSWLQYKVAWDISHDLNLRLLRTYLRRPYRYFLEHNTADLHVNLLIEVVKFTTDVLIPVCTLAARSLVVLVIFGLLIAIDPKLAFISFGVLAAAYGLIYLAFHRLLTRLGKERVDANLKLFKSMHEALAGIKTSRVYSAQDFFFRRFKHSSKHLSTIQPRVHLVSGTPRYVVEILAFGGILGVTLYLLIVQGDIQAALPMLSLYALAGYRLLPALQNAFWASAKLRHSYPIVDKLYTDLQLEFGTDQVVQGEKSLQPLSDRIELKDVTFQYDNSTQHALSQMSLSVPRGQTIALVGETGSGKTTLVDVIVGLLTPKGGGLFVDGVRIGPENLASWQRQIGYVPQQVFLFDDTITRNIAFGVDDNRIDNERVKESAQIAHIHDFISTELADGYLTTVGERGMRLSGGQQQRVGLARALYRKPAVLVLDEATSALDSITEQAVIESLKSVPEPLTVIIIAHRLSTIRHADTIYVMREGSIVASGAYDELLATSEIFREMVYLS